MGATHKVLGQSAPAATTETTLYTAPSQAVASSLVVCNRSATPTTFRVTVAVAGAATESKQYLYYDLLIGGNDSFAATLGITLAATDVIRVYAGAATLSFSLYGMEIA
jgi:hypothetical protein